MKKIAYLPVSLASTRVPNKQLLLVDGHPMISYVARACRRAEVFDEIVVDADSPVFEQLAKMLDVGYRQRSPEPAAADAGSEWVAEIAYPLTEFMKTVKDDAQVFLINPAATMIKPETLREFVKRFEKGDVDTLLGVDTTEVWGTSEKVERVTWALGAWSAKAFVNKGAVTPQTDLRHGKTATFPMSRIESLVAHTWEDVRMVEAQLVHARQKYEVGQFSVPKVYKSIEHELEGLMERDGVATFHNAGINVRQSNIQEIKAKMGKAPWCYFLFYTATDQTALICQAPGEGARTHCHVTHDEWWVVVEGEFEWRLGDRSVIKGKQGDIVFLPRGVVHTIVCTSKTDGIRLACGARDMEHIYF